MMIQRFTSFLAGLAALGLFTACAAAQVADPADMAGLDPTAPDAVVEYGGPEQLTIDTETGPVTLTVELAETAPARQRGLMHRDSLGADEGMLFDFGEERVVSIWMENTRIPLDILYIRADGSIAKIITGAQPMSRRQLFSDVPVLSVLEINSGRAAELGVAPGDRVLHRWFGTAPQGGEPAPDPAAQDAAAPAEAEEG